MPPRSWDVSDSSRYMLLWYVHTIHVIKVCNRPGHNSCTMVDRRYLLHISNSVVNAEQWIAIRLLSQNIKKNRNAHTYFSSPSILKTVHCAIISWQEKISQICLNYERTLGGICARAALYSVSIIFQQYILYAAAFSFLANWRAFRLCFLANFMFLMKLGSIPLSFIFFFTSGFLVGLRWFFLVWLWAVWFFDFAIL